MSFCYMYDLCIYCLPFVHALLFLSDADILITCVWVMVISGPYISVSVSVFVYYIMGYDVPACGCRVPFIYVCLYLYCFCSYYCCCCCWISVDGVRLMGFILLFICIFGSWDWPGVGIGVPICTDCLISSIRRPVHIFGPGGLLSVK